MADSVKIKITGDDTDFRKKMSDVGEVAKKGFKIVATAAGTAPWGNCPRPIPQVTLYVNLPGSWDCRLYE